MNFSWSEKVSVMIYSIIGRTLRFISIIGILWFFMVMSASSQENWNPTSNPVQKVENTDNKLTIKVNVEEVRLDAVVENWRGRLITDLTADDFEIYQDSRKQDITSCQYILYDQDRIEPLNKNQVEPRTIPSIPMPSLKRNSVERILIFLVNDFGMEFKHTYRTRLALRKFVEDQMLPGDLVSIIKASRGNATLQAFTSDKRELLARIDTIQWSTYNDLTNIVSNIPRVVELRKEFNFQLQAINYCIMALKDMPGRKFLLLITDYFVGPSYFNPTYDRIADAAFRAGVVIHTLNPEGIDAEDEGYSRLRIGMEIHDRIIPPDAGIHNTVPTDRFDLYENVNRVGEYDSYYGRDLPLSRKTGGLFLDNNWFINGIGDVAEEMKGYYLLSYIPPENTFSKSGKEKYHSIKVKVKLTGATVRTRDGFFGNPTDLEAPSETPPPLVEAMFSPFRYNDLNVSLASGYVDNLKEGYLLPTWMHLDGRDLSVIKKEDGKFSVSFEAGASTTDIDGLFQDYGDMQIGFQVDEAGIRKLRQDGVNFTVSIPVKKPGGYYVRVAVRDKFSEAKGSAYQFIEIPDLKENRLALSSLYIIDSEEDASWIRSMVLDESQKPSGDSKRITLRSPARKDFLRGENFEYMTVIYNAKTKKENPPDLESQIVLYRDGIEIHKSEPEPIGLNDVSDYKRIPLRKKLQLEDSMQPGDYVLQFLVRDKQAKEKQSLTGQTLSFRITEQ
jgi:VWFA-related protein